MNVDQPAANLVRWGTACCARLTLLQDRNDPAGVVPASPAVINTPPRRAGLLERRGPGRLCPNGTVDHIRIDSANAIFTVAHGIEDALRGLVYR